MNNFITFYVLLRMPYYLLISYWSSSKYLPLKLIKNVYSLMTDTLSHFYECIGLRLGIWYLTTLSTIFQLYRGGQFHRRRKLGSQRKPPTCRKSLTNFIAKRCIKYISPWVDSNSQLLWWNALIAQVVVNPTTLRSRPRKSLLNIYIDKVIRRTSNKMILYEQDVHKVKVKPRNQIDYSG